MKKFITTGCFTLALIFSAAGFAQTTDALVSTRTNGHTMITTDEIKWLDGPASLPPKAQFTILEGDLKKKEPITFRLKVPANYKIPAHWHPGIEHVTVISGAFNMGVGDKLDTSKTRELPAGSFVVIQPKVHHFAWAKEDTVVQIHTIGPWEIHYVDPADDPRKK